jgi:hypothetical protein
VYMYWRCPRRQTFSTSFNMRFAACEKKVRGQNKKYDKFTYVHTNTLFFHLHTHTYTHSSSGPWPQ